MTLSEIEQDTPTSTICDVLGGCDDHDVAPPLEHIRKLTAPVGLILRLYVEEHHGVVIDVTVDTEVSGYSNDATAATLRGYAAAMIAAAQEVERVTEALAGLPWNRDLREQVA